MSHKSWTLCPMERESRKTIFEKIFEIFSEKMAPECPCPRPGALYVMMRYYTEKQHNFWGDFEHLCQYIADLSSSYWSCLFWSLTPRGCGFDCSTSFDHLSSCKWWRWWSWYKWCNLALKYPPVKVKISVGRILRLCWCLLLLVIVMLCPVQCASVQQ